MLAVFNVLDMLIKEFNSSCHVRGYNGYTLFTKHVNGDRTDRQISA